MEAVPLEAQLQGSGARGPFASYALLLCAFVSALAVEGYWGSDVIVAVTRLCLLDDPRNVNTNRYIGDPREGSRGYVEATAVIPGDFLDLVVDGGGATWTGESSVDIRIRPMPLKIGGEQVEWFMPIYPHQLEVNVGDSGTYRIRSSEISAQLDRTQGRRFGVPITGVRVTIQLPQDERLGGKTLKYMMWWNPDNLQDTAESSFYVATPTEWDAYVELSMCAGYALIVWIVRSLMLGAALVCILVVSSVVVRVPVLHQTGWIRQSYRRIVRPTIAGAGAAVFFSVFASIFVAAVFKMVRVPSGP